MSGIKKILTRDIKSVFLFCAIVIAVFLGIAQTFFSTTTGKIVLKNSALAAITTLGEVCGGSTEDIGRFVGPMFNTDTCLHCKAVCEIIGGPATAYLRDSISTLCACGQPAQPLPPETGTCPSSTDCGGTFYHTVCNTTVGGCVAIPGKGTNECYADSECALPPTTLPGECNFDTDCNDSNICTTDTCKGETQDYFRAAVLDNVNGNAFFSTHTIVGQIAVVRLSDFTKLGVINAPSSSRSLTSAVIDEAGGYAYFGTGNAIAGADVDPAEIVKVRLSDLVVVETLKLSPGEKRLTSAVIDPARGFAYFGTDTNPGKIIKINLATFTKVATLTYSTGEGFFYTAVIDPGAGYAYFGTDDFPGAIMRIRLSDFTKAGKITLATGENRLQSSIIDTAAGFAYFGARWSGPSRIVKINLSTFTRSGALTLSGADFINSAVIDPVNHIGYFGTDNAPAQIVKVNLTTLTQSALITLPTGENSLDSAVIDSANQFAYFGTYTAPGKVVKIQLPAPSRVGAITFSIDSVNPAGQCFADLKTGTHLACGPGGCYSAANTISTCTNQDGCSVLGGMCTPGGGGVCPKSTCPFDANTRYTDGYFPYFGGTDNDIYDYFFGSERITNIDAEAFTSRSCNNDSRGGVTRGVKHMRAVHSVGKVIDVAIDPDESSTFRNFLITTLHDARGWEQAGVTFNILPRGCTITSCTQTDLWVEKGTANKAGGRGSYNDRCSTDPVEFPHQDHDYFRMETGGGCIYSYNNCTRWLINHEVGHALGLTDRENKTEAGLDKLMNHLTFSGAGSDKEVWPSAGDILLVSRASNCDGRDCLR